MNSTCKSFVIQSVLIMNTTYPGKTTFGGRLRHLRQNCQEMGGDRQWACRGDRAQNQAFYSMPADTEITKGGALPLAAATKQSDRLRLR